MLGQGLRRQVTPPDVDPVLTNALAAVFARPPAPGIGARLPPLPGGRPVAAPKGVVAPARVRRVFYSFHYRDVFRVNHVRNSNKIRGTDTGRQLTPEDRSLWEKMKRTNPLALRRMIDSRVNGTTVTCVLAGFEAWSREWVRYEIARSLVRGNGLLTVFIDGCKCPREGFAARGPNPLDQIALGWDQRIYEWRDGGFYLYDKITERLSSWPLWLPRPPEGQAMQLSRGACAYDWMAHDGFNNLIAWTNAAALNAGR